MRDLASRVLKKAGKAGCKFPDCRILVANFTLNSGDTSPLGIRLADSLSQELAIQQKAIQVIDRSQLRAYIEQERIPAQVFKQEEVIQGLGKQFGATTVLIGATWQESGYLHVRVNLLSCEEDKRSPLEELAISYPELETSLRAVDPYSKNPPVSQQSIPNLSRAGVDGVTSPICVYCPNPDYTDPARKVKFNGTLLLDITVSAEGRAIDASVVRGLPFGLNESAIRTIHDWQFKPATRRGQPLACRVMLEVTFRLH